MSFEEESPNLRDETFEFMLNTFPMFSEQNISFNRNVPSILLTKTQIQGLTISVRQNRTYQCFYHKTYLAIVKIKKK